MQEKTAEAMDAVETVVHAHHHKHAIQQEYAFQHAHQTAQARIVEAMDAAAHAEHAQEHKHAAQQDNAILSALHYVRQTAQEKFVDLMDVVEAVELAFLLRLAVLIAFVIIL